MTHIRITTGKDVQGFARIELDGQDISKFVAVDGFGVDFPTELGGEAVVHLPVLADALEIDLPRALIEALRIGGDES